MKDIFIQQVTSVEDLIHRNADGTIYRIAEPLRYRWMDCANPMFWFPGRDCIKERGHREVDNGDFALALELKNAGYRWSWNDQGFFDFYIEERVPEGEAQYLARYLENLKISIKYRTRSRQKYVSSSTGVDWTERSLEVASQLQSYLEDYLKQSKP